MFIVFLRFLPVVCISRVNGSKITEDRPGQREHEIFSIKRRFQVSTSQSAFKEACERWRQRAVLLKKSNFTAVGSSSVKMVADTLYK